MHGPCLYFNADVEGQAGSAERKLLQLKSGKHFLRVRSAPAPSGSSVDSDQIVRRLEGTLLLREVSVWP